MSRIGVILGSTRPGRNGEQVAHWVQLQATQHAGERAEFDVLDLMEFDLPLLDESLPAVVTPGRNAHTRRWAEAPGMYDAYILVTPEYNGSAPASLRNAIDYLFREWAHKAVGYVGYGIFGALTAVHELRSQAGRLNMADIAPQVALSLSEDFVDNAHFKPRQLHTPRLQQLVDDLLAWNTALAPLRARAEQQSHNNGTERNAPHANTTTSTGSQAHRPDAVRPIGVGNVDHRTGNGHDERRPRSQPFAARERRCLGLPHVRSSSCGSGGTSRLRAGVVVRSGSPQRHRHRFGYEVQLAGGQSPEAMIAITDETTGKYFTRSQAYRPDQVSISAADLDVRLPGADLSGSMNAMHLHASLPAGAINLTLRPQGPALYNNGTGLMPFLGGTSYYYSLPRLASKGTLTENHHTYSVTGQSWLDRQWGNWEWSTVQKWTWMPIQLSNGSLVNLWDMYSRDGHFHYATVLRTDGTEQLVSVNSLTRTTSKFWTSSTTGKRYGTRWSVRIPALLARLRVTAQPGQEVLAYGGIFEGAARVTGTYRGARVTGRAYAEQLGNWQ